MTTSAKSALRSPVSTDTPDVPRDILNLTADLDGRVVTVCTSGTRPTGTAAFAGAFIFETDTLLARVYTGSTWVLIIGRGTPSASVSKIANQAIGSSTLSGLTHDTQNSNVGFTWSSTVNPSRLICVEPGLYSVTGTVLFSSNSTGSRIASLAKNGGATLAPDGRGASASSLATSMTSTRQMRFAAGDYVEVFGYQDSGSTLNMTGCLEAFYVSD